jgi:hypothetical protein
MHDHFHLVVVALDLQSARRSMVFKNWPDILLTIFLKDNILLPVLL